MFAYFGGKYFQSDWIQEFIPEDIEFYSEVFGGAFWIYIKGDFTNLLHYSDLETVVYNDLNKNNVNLFKCIKDYKKLYDILKDIVDHDESLFFEYRDSLLQNGDLNNFILSEDSDFERAKKYCYCLTHVFSGTEITKNVSMPKKGKHNSSKFKSFQKRLNDYKIRNLIKKITKIENLDCIEFIQKYDKESSFFYCDPPYVDVAKYSINSFNSLESHLTFLNVLKKIKGRFLLSYYYFPELENIFPKNKYRWEEKKFRMKACVTVQKQNTEILIMNY